MLKCENAMVWFYGIMYWICFRGGADTHFLKSRRVASKQSDCGDWSVGSHYPGIKSPLSHNLWSRFFCFWFLLFISTNISLFVSVWVTTEELVNKCPSEQEPLFLGLGLNLFSNFNEISKLIWSIVCYLTSKELLQAIRWLSGLSHPFSVGLPCFSGRT